MSSLPVMPPSLNTCGSQIATDNASGIVTLALRKVYIAPTWSDDIRRAFKPWAGLGGQPDRGTLKERGSKTGPDVRSGCRSEVDGKAPRARIWRNLGATGTSCRSGGIWARKPVKLRQMLLVAPMFVYIT